MWRFTLTPVSERESSRHYNSPEIPISFRSLTCNAFSGKSTSSLPLEMVQQMAEYFAAPGQNVNVEENVNKKRPPFTISSDFESPKYCFCFLTFAAIPSKGNPAAADVVVSTNIYNFVYRFRYGSSDTKDLEGLVWPTPLKDTSDYNKSLSGKFGLV